MHYQPYSLAWSDLAAIRTQAKGPTSEKMPAGLAESGSVDPWAPSRRRIAQASAL
jgi:hypothetical protein